jgi:hypothetical protein
MLSKCLIVTSVWNLFRCEHFIVCLNIFSYFTGRELFVSIEISRITILVPYRTLKTEFSNFLMVIVTISWQHTLKYVSGKERQDDNTKFNPALHFTVSMQLRPYIEFTLRGSLSLLVILIVLGRIYSMQEL